MEVRLLLMLSLARPGLPSQDDWTLTGLHIAPQHIHLADGGQHLHQEGDVSGPLLYISLPLRHLRSSTLNVA